MLQQLIDALRILPGVGPKSRAQRIALRCWNETALELCSCLRHWLWLWRKVGHCQQCRTFCETDLCAICSDPRRSDSQSLCIVASSSDQFAIEQTGQFKGRYFVLAGPVVATLLDGIGPSELGLDLLQKQLGTGSVQEVILATNPTVEGDATANYIAEQCKKYKVNVSRIAHGVPVGGDLEYVDGTTLSHAFSGRKPI